ncbi:MAG: CPBP family intramembrane metalloprotease [Firmicutes bacterium]|nr:CPBP family intramembrane metalloprotease [Bacillota bacterium]
MIKASSKAGMVFALAAAVIFCAVMTVTEQVVRPTYWIKCAVKAGLILPALIIYARTFRIDLRDVTGLYPMKAPRSLFLMTGGACAVILAAFFLLRGRLDLAGIRASLMSKEGLTKENCLFVFTYIIICNSFLEEVFFRGFLTGALKERMGFWRAAVLSAAFFALYHIGIVSGWFSLPVMALAVAGLMAAGIILQLADRSRGSLKAGWLIHAGANLVINAIGAWLIFFG